MSVSNRSEAIFLVFHTVAFIVYSYSFYYDLYNLPYMQHRASYGGRFKFLTFWNFVIQWIFFGFSVLNDLCGSNVMILRTRRGKKTSNDDGNVTMLQRIRDTAVAVIGFPACLVVTVTFWGIFVVNREMVYPEALDKIIPSWLNHIWHTTGIFLLVIEKFLIYHEYPSSRAKGLAGSILFGLVYQIWIFWIAYHGNIWVYPILEALSWPLRICFLLGCFLLLVASYLLGELITHTFWNGSLSAAGRVKVK